MKVTGSINRADIGRFRNTDDVRTYKKIKSVMDTVSAKSKEVAKHDNSSGDYNEDSGVVLLDQRSTTRDSALEWIDSSSAFLDEESGEFKSTDFNSKPVLNSKGWGAQERTRELVRLETDQEIVWSDKKMERITIDAHTSGRKFEVREDKRSGVITLLEQRL